MLSVPRIRCTNSDVTRAGWKEPAPARGPEGVASVTATQPEPDPFLWGGLGMLVAHTALSLS